MPNINPPSPSSSTSSSLYMGKQGHHSQHSPGLAIVYDLIYKEQFDLALAALSRCLAREWEVCKIFTIIFFIKSIIKFLFF